MKLSARIFPLTAALLLAACGDEVTQINQTGLEVYSAEKDLPECTAKNEGEQAWIKGEPSVRICSDGEWFALSSNADAGNGDFACKTEELKDKSGLKIVCNGDSIGVVLNGSDGEDGKDGKDGDDGKDGEDGKDAVLPNDTLEADSERVPLQLASLEGYTQKGPFLKGSTVYLYELSDGRTLKQTNGNFTSYITRDDGRYKFSARDLVSQYAMIVVDGNYRNEVTGLSSNAPIRLRAITDMRKRSSANVNLLTTLEFDRVYHLVTRGDEEGNKLTVKQAKKRAQAEIFKAFHIDTTGFDGSAEDLDVFGSGDADAALLAISVLLQGDQSESELVVLLTEISSALEEKGDWTGDRADSIKASIADWAFMKDLKVIRKNVEGWGLHDSNGVGNFERQIENFYETELGLQHCGDGDEGKKQTIHNRFSEYDGKTYFCYNGIFAYKPDNPNLNKDVEYGELFDPRNRRIYRTVKIGEQTWMAENLDFDYKVKLAGQTHYSSYGNTVACDADSCLAFGRYYTWGAAMDSAGVYSDEGTGCGYDKTCFAGTYDGVHGLCPEHWELPDSSAWRTLYKSVNSSVYPLQATGFVKWPGATNESGLSLNPNRTNATLYWTSIEYDISQAYNMILWAKDEDGYEGMEFFNGEDSGYPINKPQFFPIRCIWRWWDED